MLGGMMLVLVCWRVLMEVKWSDEGLEIGEPVKR